MIINGEKDFGFYKATLYPKGYEVDPRCCNNKNKQTKIFSIFIIHNYFGTSENTRNKVINLIKLGL